MSAFQRFIFAWGCFSALIVLYALAYIAVEAVKDLIDHLKYQHRIKHRFDKPPTAKCYCKDCRWHYHDGRCDKFETWLTADNWFCWDAEPKEVLDDAAY